MEEKVKFTLNALIVDKRTRKKFMAWIDESGRKYPVLVQQLILFATDNGFDPLTARIKWKDEE